MLCTVSGRDCRYATTQVALVDSPSTLASTPDKPSPNSQHDFCTSRPESIPVPDSDILVVNDTPVSHPDTSQRPDMNHGEHLIDLDESINLSHMELFIHAIVDKDMFSLSGSHGGLDYRSQLSAGLGAGLKSPYLLYQLFAFSARHFAFLHPDRSSSYLDQAVALQTRAISVFNSAWTQVDQSNCVAVLLFSTILGHHLLVDTLAMRDPGGLDTFMSHYVQCVEMHRGIHTIALGAWPLLMESELEPILSASAAFTSQSPKGNDCERVVELVERANSLDEPEKDACLSVIQHLQVGFDALCTTGVNDEEETENRSTRYQMISSWALLAPPEFTALLTAKKPEVLVILAYYALLLHHGRHMWQVRDAGSYILKIVRSYLGADWDYWLEYPRQVMARDLGTTLWRQDECMSP